MVVIAGGKYRGKRIEVPAGESVRPTSGKMRAAIFDMLAHNPGLPPLSEMTVLDLYAGSGALGFEALSRGAKRVQFVESDPEHQRFLAAAAAGFKAEQARIGIHKGTAVDWLKSRREPLGLCLAFIDPPYRSGQYGEVLPLLASLSHVAGGSVVVVESPHEDGPPRADGLEPFRTRRHGKSHIDILLKA